MRRSVIDLRNFELVAKVGLVVNEEVENLGIASQLVIVWLDSDILYSPKNAALKSDSHVGCTMPCDVLQNLQKLEKYVPIESCGCSNERLVLSDSFV
jgi:hypothetical protein